MRTNQPAPEHCWEPADNPRSASGWIVGAALQKALISLLFPLSSLSLRFRHNIILILILSPLLLPLPFPAGSLPPCWLQRLSMRTSCLPMVFPLGAGPGKGEVGTVQAQPRGSCLPGSPPASRTLFLLALSSLNTWGLYSWDLGLALEPSHLGALLVCPWGAAQGALGFGMCPHSFPAPCHSPATSSHHSTALLGLEVVKTWLYLFLELFCGSGYLSAGPQG